MILFYCIGLHESGGLTILNKIISNTNIKNLNYYFDDRIKTDQLKNIKEKNFKKSNIFSRIIRELSLSLNKKIEKIFYINGLPPMFKNKDSYVIVLFQNTNIFKTKYRSFFSWFFSKDFLRFIKFFLFKSLVDEWVVLSTNAQRELKNKLPRSSKIILIQLDKNNNFKKNNFVKKYDFFYPATLGYHKNHKKLLDSFVALSKENIFPSLLLTLKKNELIKTNFEKIILNNSLKITFKYFNSSEIQDAYNKSKALIFPSLNETLGLPLLEAKKNNLDILASELDYVRDISDPCETFDPNSSLSISRAIKRYLSINNNIEKKFFLDYESYQDYLILNK